MALHEFVALTHATVFYVPVARLNVAPRLVVRLAARHSAMRGGQKMKSAFAAERE